MIKQIRLTNQIGIIVLVSAIPYYFIFSKFNLTLAANIVWVILFLFLLTFTLNHYHHYHMAKMVVILTQSLAFPFYSVYLGYPSGAHLLFVPLAILPLIFYPTKDVKNYRRLGFSIVFSSMIIMAVMHRLFPFFTVPLDNVILTNLNGFAFLTTLGLVLPQVNIFNQSEQQATERLFESNMKLNQALVDLKESRNAQMLLTQHADYAKLVQSIAHEFKNPLQMLQGTAEVGLKYEESRDLFKVVLQSVDRLNYVIHPMLNYLNTEEKYEFKPFNIIKTIKDIVILSKANCESKQIELSIVDKLSQSTVYGDPKAIGQVFINLITNAIDAIGNQGGVITIECINEMFVSDEDAVDGVKINFIDNGCGLNEGDLKRIFVPFESSKKTKSNVGLGLSIVSKIIKDHHGLIKASSTLNKGTVISIFLQTSMDQPRNKPQKDLFNLEADFFEG